MTRKIVMLAALALLLLTLTACGLTASPAPEDRPPAVSDAQAPDVPHNGETEPSDGGGSTDEAWKQTLSDSLFEQYGVIPDHYEDLGDGIYQVYVEVGGKVVPFVTVDSATGDYHG